MPFNTLFPDPALYEEQLQTKQQALHDILSAFELPELEVFASPTLHYRQRAEFKIWHEKDKASYAMFPDGANSQPHLMTQFPVACEAIYQLMPLLMTEINTQPVLKTKLFQMEFLSTLSGQTLVTLVYHRKLDEEWEIVARKLETEFQVFVVGRSRKQKIILSQDYVEEAFSLNNFPDDSPNKSPGKLRTFRYKQLEGCFAQPNAAVCIHMLNWASDSIAGLNAGSVTDSIATAKPNTSNDLLELYCGNGNFTLPLSRYFDKALATEISKPLTKAALENCATNGISNIKFARLSAEEVTQALNKEREFRRLKEIDLDSYHFSTVFVDPPRAGMDEKTNQLVQRFENILYISCNPKTLSNNLESLTKTHSIERLALFDQFPYTEHMECGVLLRKQQRT